ncbi:hypothetical protein [Clostridium sp.]|jgi:hypothetical protein|uniref:hypothetical protein n=1 Tax=Clostridium sp. TaxID=1506 RepID=UPI003EEB79B0
MNKTLLKWFIILIFCFVVSTFLYEIAHGLSSFAAGNHVSTGFNKVGQPYKKPHDLDFRKGLENDENPWDMGPTTTLILAVGFTLALVKSKNKNQVIIMIIGAFALCNSLVRLIPMVHSYLGLITKGSFYLEDEVGTGILWYKLYGLEIMKYIPSLISIVVSLFCLHFVIKTLQIKLPDLFSKRVYFTMIVIFAYIISFSIESGLDNIIRINWV